MLIQCSQILDECLQTFWPIEVRDLLNPGDWDFPLDLQFLHGCCNAGTQHGPAFGSYDDGADALIHFVSEERSPACRANCNQNCDEGFTCARLATNKRQALKRHNAFDQHLLGRWSIIANEAKSL